MIRKPVRLAAIFGALAIFAVSALGVAVAAPASVDSLRECGPDSWEGIEGSSCFTIQSVEMAQTNGKTVHSGEHGSMLIEFFDDEGNLVFSDKTQWHTTVVEKDGETHVAHDKTRVTFTVDGETCTAEMNVVYANGEVRRLGPSWEWDCR